MKKNPLSHNLILIMLLIYMIAALQFALRESSILWQLKGLSYSEQLDSLDKSYYRQYFHRYSAWLASMLPPDKSFSIFNDGTDCRLYDRYVRKFNYYLYPRHVLFNGVDMYAYHNTDSKAIESIVYPEFLLSLDIQNMDLYQAGKLRFVILKGKRYYLIAQMDNKALLAQSEYLNKNLSLLPQTTRDGFEKYYGFRMKEGMF